MPHKYLIIPQVSTPKYLDDTLFKGQKPTTETDTEEVETSAKVGAT